MEAWEGKGREMGGKGEERRLVGSLPATGGKRTAIRPRKMSPEHIFLGFLTWLDM